MLDPRSALRFVWAADGEADRFLAVLKNARDEEAARAETSVCEWILPMEELEAGEYCLRLTAFYGELTVGEADLLLSLSEKSAAPAQGGSRPGRSSGGRSGQGGITPGQALTTSHARGGGSLTPYDAVALDLPEEASDTLVLGGTALDVTRGGAPVTAALGDDGADRTLAVSAGGEDSPWRVSLGALDTLRRSGLQTLILTGEDGMLEIRTDWEPSGPAYARERAKGLTADDFALVWDGNGVTLTVEDRVYPMDGQPPLTAKEDP